MKRLISILLISLIPSSIFAIGGLGLNLSQGSFSVDASYPKTDIPGVTLMNGPFDGSFGFGGYVYIDLIPFVDIEFGISLKCAELAFNAGIPNASVISAGGANANAWAVDWIHPLLYTKTIGMKEETLTKHFSFKNVSIFRPGMLIRYYDKTSPMQRFFNKSNLGLPVKLLASAIKRDSESITLDDGENEILIYSGNKCIKSAIQI